MGDVEIQTLGSVGELISGVAVLVTLIYLARQIRQSNTQALQQSYQSTMNSLNELSGLIADSDELASIMVKGRASLDDLSDAERLRFESVHLRFLNTVEAWLEEIRQTYPKGRLRDQHMANVSVGVDYFFKYPGARALWPEVSGLFPPDVHELMDAYLAR